MFTANCALPLRASVHGRLPYAALTTAGALAKVPLKPPVMSVAVTLPDASLAGQKPTRLAASAFGSCAMVTGGGDGGGAGGVTIATAMLSMSVVTSALLGLVVAKHSCAEDAVGVKVYVPGEDHVVP